MRKILVMAVLLAMLPSVPARAATIFNFETVAAGTADPFSVTVDGITAAFSSPTVFQVNNFQPNTLFSGRSLYSADGASGSLVAGFNTTLSNVSLNYAVNSGLPQTFTLEAFLGGIGGTLVGTVVQAASAQTGFPGGTITFTGMFDTLRFDSPAPDIAVDNITVTAAVPEPASLILLGSGLAGVVARARRRRQQQLQ